MVGQCHLATCLPAVRLLTHVLCKLHHFISSALQQNVKVLLDVIGFLNLVLLHCFPWVPQRWYFPDFHAAQPLRACSRMNRPLPHQPECGLAAENLSTEPECQWYLWWKHHRSDLRVLGDTRDVYHWGWGERRGQIGHVWFLLFFFFFPLDRRFLCVIQ